MVFVPHISGGLFAVSNYSGKTEIKYLFSCLMIFHSRMVPYFYGLFKPFPCQNFVMFLSGICEENVRKSLEIGNVWVVG